MVCRLLTLLPFVAMVAESASPVVRVRRLNYFKDSVVDGLETYYNEYAQAWRFLGLYVDCQNAEAAAEHRRLQGGDNEQHKNQNEEKCGRYFLWAAVSFGLVELCAIKLK
jgi:hypothetical protein